MAANAYYGNDMALTVDKSDGTNIPVGILKDVELVDKFEVDKQWGGDSVKRQNVKQREFEVLVSVGVAKYDVTIIQEHLGGSGASSTSVVDTSDPALFTITGEVTPTGGGTNLKGVVTSVVFPEMPVFSVSEGEYAVHELEGAGADITVTGP